MAFPIKYNSPVVLTFALVCTAVFILFDQNSINQLFAVGTSVSLSDPISVFNLFSHVLGHSSMEHLIGNLTFILLVGPIIEEKYGSGKTLLMIILTALITGLLNITLFSTGLLGASGIVFMFILLVSFTNTSGGQIPLTFILVALLFVGKEVLNSLDPDRISQFAHIIGGVCGSVFGFIGGKKTSSSPDPEY